MKIRSSLPVLAALTVPLLLALQPRGDEISFQPEAGSKLAKELKIEQSFSLEDLSVTMNGQELPPGEMGDIMGESLLVSALISVTDEFVSSKRGKHVELLRTYEKLTLEGGLEGDTERKEDLGGFEGTTVRFKWDEEESDYAITLEEGHGDEEALEDLSPDMDFLALLPDGEVSPGDTWSVGGDELWAVFLPGGLFPFPVDDEDDEELSQVLEDELGEQFMEAFKDFVIVCTYKGSHEEEGARIGEIEFKFDGKASIDLADLISTIIDMQSRQQEMDFDVQILASVDLELKGSGTLLWHLGGHRVQSFEMSSDMILLADIEADTELMGEPLNMALSAEVSGDGSWTMSTRAAD